MELAIHYASEQTRQNYNKAEIVLRALIKNPALIALKNIGSWNPDTNTLTLFLVAGKDIDPQEKYKNIKWKTQTPRAMPETKEGIDVSSYLTQQSRVLYKIISDSANQSNLMPKQDFQSLVLKSPDQVFAAIGGVAASSLQQRYTATNFLQYLNDNHYNIVLVSVPDTPTEEYQQKAKRYSGLEKEMYKLQGSEMAHYIATLAHELAHGIMGDDDSEFGDGQYNYVALNHRINDKRAWGEAVADVVSALALDDAEKLGIISADDKNVTLKEIESLRAIGNFYLSPNSLNIANNVNSHIHLTTVLFDHSRRGITDDFWHVSQAKSFSAIPSIVNSLAYALSGFVYAHHLEEDIKRHPKNYSKETRMAFSGLVKSPVGATMPFIDIGVRVQYGAEPEDELPAIKARPAYYFQAMKYLKDTGGFAGLKKALRPELRPVFDDLIADYFKGVSFVGEENFYDDRIAGEFKRYMPYQLNITTLLKEIITVSNDPNRVGRQFEGDRPADEEMFTLRLR